MRRSGISLLEVMFSIGVVVIGIFGVIALLPLAGHRAKQGLIADGAAASGLNAYREFRARGMNDPTQWLWWSNSDSDFIVPDLAPMNRQLPFCIDPRFVAAAPQINSFPYANGGSPVLRMRRVTLRAGGVPMERAVADYVFQSKDDLAIEYPTDRTLSPEQIVFRVGTDDVRRQFNGAYSWMATVAPKLDHRQGPAASTSNRYTLSIVVFHGREISATMIQPVANEPDNERAVLVDGWSGGFAGGDAVLALRSTDRPITDLEVRQGEWIMLQGPSEGDEQQSVRWYRVNSMSEPYLDGDGVWKRRVSLMGAHNPPALPPQPTPSWTQATLVNGVVAVFERTIELLPPATP